MILVDPMLASGGSAIRAIQVLKVKLTELLKLMSSVPDLNVLINEIEKLQNVKNMFDDKNKILARKLLY